ncbi:uncharacterized protein LOC143462303 [Clavelina lepadiformis]|uniref:uncharacterized protein LOC143462303 n=1 Tax=Clavelina lepadiformis TaxID=159417 RepID=UPI0040412039
MSNATTSSTVQNSRSKKRVTKSIAVPISHYGRVAGWPSGGAYMVVSPIMVPYVQAPVHYANGKGKTEISSPSTVKVRYVPAYTYTPCQPAPYVYRKAMPVQYCYQSGSHATQYVYQKSMSLRQAYVSALAPTTGYVLSSEVSQKSHSDLNPLSRPYTPPSRLKPCTCEQNENEDVECPRHPKRRSSDCSSPDNCYDDTFSEITSRGPTPIGGTCPYCRKEKNWSTLSDTDSGVEGESDDEAWCTCYEDLKNKWRCISPSSSENDGDEDYCDLRLPKEDETEISDNTSRLIDFVCEHLASHEWRTVARELGVCDVVIQSIEYDMYDSFRDQMKYVFSYWARSEVDFTDSERRRLMSVALSEIGRKDLIEKLDTEEV